MRERLLAAAKVAAFPVFYLACLGLFGYLKFPYDRLRDRLVLEFEKRGKPGQHLEIGKLGSYWLTGVELANVKLHIPPEEPAPGIPDFGGGSAKETVITIDEAHARVRILPLLIGRVRLDFWASAFGGEIKGTVPVGDGKGDVDITIDRIEIGKIEPLAQTVGVPIKGIASGKIALAAQDGKFSKANGSVELTIEGAAVSDGKTKIQGLIELPQAKLGTITFVGEAKDGQLKVSKLAANGPDLELAGDGKIALKEPWSEAIADIFLRFKFTDTYRGKNATTKSLLGEPGSATPGLIEMQVPKMKKAKRPDGFFGWHIYGPLKKLKFDPTTADYAAGSSPAAPAKRGKDSPFGGGARKALPLGPSTAKPTDANPPPTPAANGEPEPARPAGDVVPRRAPALPDVVAPINLPPLVAPAPQPAPTPPPEQPAAPAPQPEQPAAPAPQPEQPAAPDQPVPVP
jgi:type II secretion system protein N